MTSKRFVLRNDLIRANCADWALSAAPVDCMVTFSQLTRSLAQNSKFHAICSDVAKQHSYGGKKRTAAQWKVLFISGHSIATGHGADMMPGLENEFVNLRESSAGMSVSRLASLIEYCLAYCATNDIKLAEASNIPDWVDRRMAA